MNLVAKKIILSSLVTVGWIGVYFYLNQLFGANSFSSLRPWVLFFVFAAVLNASLAFIALLRNPLIFALNALGTPVIIALLSGNSRMTLALMILALGTLSIYAFAKYLTESVSLRVFSVSYRHIGFSALASVAALTVVLLSIFGAASADNVSSKAVDAIWPYVQKMSPQFNSDLTVDEYLTKEIQDQGIQRPSRQMLEEGRRQFNEQFKIEVNGDQKVSDIGKAYVSGQVSDIVDEGNIGKALPLLIFLTLLVLIPFIKLVYAAATWVLYLILKQSKFITIGETQINAKKILI